MELGMEDSILQYGRQKEHSLAPFYFIVFTNNVLPSPDIVQFEQDLVDIHQTLAETKKDSVDVRKQTEQMANRTSNKKLIKRKELWFRVLVISGKCNSTK